MITTSSLIIIKSVIIVQTIFFWLIQGYIIAPKTLFINEQYVCVLYYYVDNDLTCLPTVIEEKKNPPYILTSFCLFFFVLSLFIRPFYTFSLSLSFSFLLDDVDRVNALYAPELSTFKSKFGAFHTLFFVVLICYQQSDIPKKTKEVRLTTIDKKF